MPTNFKDQTNNQFARTSTSIGNRSVPNPDGPDQGIEPLADDNGRLVVRLADSGGFITIPGSLGESLHYVQSGYVENGSIGLVPSILALIYGFNNNTSLRFIQLFNGAPAPGDTPLISIPVPGNNGTFSLEPFARMTFSTLIWFASSTTGNIYTASGTNDFWINADYYTI